MELVLAKPPLVGDKILNVVSIIQPLPAYKISNVFTTISDLSNNMLKLFQSNKITFTVKINPPIEELKEIEKDEKMCFKFNNKTNGAYIECYKNSEYYNEYYKTFGKPEIYGLYEINNETNTEIIIGTISLIYRYKDKVCHIMDLKIKKSHRGTGGVNKFIRSTIFRRIIKNNGYYGICFNKNTIIENLVEKISMPKMENNGEMYIYLVSYDDIIIILPILSSFYCSEIAFIDNNKIRLIVNSTTKKSFKILHLHHNADYCEKFDFSEPQKGYQYCFSIHESNKYIIQELKTKYNINSSSTATVYSNDFKADWSKFVKTFEI